MTRPVTFFVAAALVVACSAAPDDKNPSAADAGTSTDGATPTDAGSGPRPLPDGGPAPTWTYLYAQYFGAASIGHCGNAGCHQGATNGFQCLPTKDGCYNGLVDYQLIDPTNPRASKLANVSTTPLAWFGTFGTMPQGNRAANQQAADEISAWVFAGAKND